MSTHSYIELETLYEGHRTRVVRARDEAGHPVILKQLRAQWPTPSELSRLRREHDLLTSLRGSGALSDVRLETEPTPQLVTNDPGAVPLSAWWSEARSSVATALQIASNLTQCLAAIHERGVLHRDLNPTNCVVHPETHQVWLIDFDLASPIPRRRARPQPLANLEGTPAYLAPEQTGRMNRVVDARSDLYALGITLYELFSGRPPFSGDDVLAYAHAHLALTPPELRPIVAGLPDAAITLVETLIRKHPEDRYQSAAGVVVDLSSLIAGLNGPATALSGRTLTTQLEIPQRLYGRERALDSLNEALSATCRGAVQVVLLEGEAGTGKTALVHELYKPATLAGAWLLEGKFDQFSRGVPYTALGQVLTAFVKDVLSAPTAEVERWRERIMAATAPNPGLLIRLAPDLELLLGPQPAVAELGPTESQRRLHETLRRAFGAIAGPKSPMVIFLDDLQWADLPSLRLLEALFRDPELSHLMLIGSWRSEDIDAEHTLRPIVAAIEESGAAPTRITLGPLEPTEVAALFADALHRGLDEVGPLVDVLHEKTGGNPFFLHRLLSQAADTGAIFFDLESRAWKWDLARLESIGIADNVIALLRMELDHVSGPARVCLSAAALLGEDFGLEALAMATRMPRDRVRTCVRDAIAARFLYPIDDDWWAADGDEAPRFRFAFVHDRIQQAARSLASEEERLELQLALARGLSASPQVQATPFQAAEHYAAVLDRVAEPVERRTARDILAHAGERALKSAAFAPAHRFLQAAIRASADAIWSEEPDRARALWSHAARAAWLVNDNASFESHIRELRDQAQSLVDLLEVEEIFVQATIARGALHAALDAALAILVTAGVDLPRKPGLADVGAAIEATMGAVGECDIEHITDRVCTDDIESAVRGLMVRVASAAYVAEPNLLPLIACDLVQRTITSGASRESSYGFGVYSLCLCAGWLLEAGDEQGQVALALLERFPDRALDGPVRHVVNHFSRVWNAPLRDVYDASPDVYRSLMDAGDLEYAGWVLHMRVVNGLFSGVHLDELADEIDMAIRIMELHGVQSALHCTLQFEQLVKNLRGQSEDPTRLAGDSYDGLAHFAQYVDSDFRAAALALSLCRQMAALYFDGEDALRATDDVMAFQDGAAAMFYQCPMRVYGAIALLASERDEAQALTTVLEWRAPVAACAERMPANGRHLLALMDAEIARASGDVAEATRQYDTAIVHAGRGGFTHDEALANERAATMHLANGSERISRAYLLDARHGWLRWGASAKVAQLDRTYPKVLSAAIVGEPARRRARLTSSIDPSSEETLTNHTLDIDSVLKASQAIAEEVQLDSLLSRSMGILLESVGARRGALLLARRGELRIEAIGEVGQPARLVAGAPFESGADVAPSIVRRVWRKGLAEVHDDARDSKVADAHLFGDHPLSVLCAPITYRGRQLGVVYFENDLSAGAFTPAQVRVLEVLAPQLAVTIRNVRLHEAQSRFVPAQFIRSLGHEDIVDVEVGDYQTKQVSVFFSDIWGFTRLVEQLDAQRALALINRYLSFAEPAITGSGGFIDTYLGDGIMALFDEPSLNAQRAVTAAIACHRTLDRFNLERRRSGLAEIRTGIGINTGVVTMGTIGGQHSLKCGVVGDAVNLASRIEGLTRRTGSRLLISDETVAHLSHPDALTFRRAGRVRVQGRQTPVTVYEVLDAESLEIIDARRGTLERFELALDAYYDGQMADAVSGLAACLQQAPGDVLASRFMALAQDRQVRGVPEGWDGIESLTEK